jgi:protein-disulfide isomerase
VFRHFPLRHLHPLADWLAEHTELAHLQDRFWPLHELLMAERRMARPLAERAMAAVGVEADALSRHIEAIRARVEADVQRGKADGVHSTPSFFLNGRPHDGHYDLDTLREQIRLALLP